MTRLRYVVIKNKSRYLSPQEKVTEISRNQQRNIKFSVFCDETLRICLENEETDC